MCNHVLSSKCVSSAHQLHLFGLKRDLRSFQPKNILYLLHNFYVYEREKKKKTTKTPHFNHSVYLSTLSSSCLNLSHTKICIGVWLHGGGVEANPPAFHRPTLRIFWDRRLWVYSSTVGSQPFVVHVNAFSPWRH